MKRIMTQVITLVLVMTAMIGGGSTASATTVVSIGDLTCDDDGTVTVEIMLSDVQNYGTGKINITYNPSVVHVTGVAGNSNSAVVTHNADNAAGITSIAAWNTGGVSGDVVFASMTFEAVGTGSTPLGIDVVKMRDTSMTTPIPVTVDNGSITIGGTEPPTSFVITGHVSDSDGSPCNGAWVQITNTNTSVSWDAENSSTSNYYRLAISSDDVSEGDVLQFDASGCSESKIVEHTVVQSEIDSGGFTETITLKGDEPPLQQPDLEITEKYETLADGTFTVTYIVTNIGGAAAGASTTCIYIDGVLAATDSVPALEPAESHTGTVGPFDCPCGTTVTVKVCADNDSVVDESDETNNCRENELTCQVCSEPDLVITQKSETWVSMDDKTYSITYTIANTGTADADASTTFIMIDGKEVATDPVPELSAGESYTKTLGPFTMSGDDDAIKVCADRDDVVSESNEVNNCREDIFRHQSAAVPVLTPFGLAVLIILLSVFSVMNIRRRGK